MSVWNEEEVLADYCAGILKYREITEKHGIPKSTLIDLVKRKGVTRNKAPAVPAKKKPTNPTKKPDQKTRPKNPTKNSGREIGRTGKVTDVDDERASIIEEDSLADDVDDLGFEPSDFGLSLRQAIFVFWYIKTKSRVEAYRKSGYSGEGNTAYVNASRMLRNAKVTKAVRALEKSIRERYTAELDEIVDQLVAITRADPNAITQYRRVNCRFCWGEKNHYQWRDSDEIDKAQAKAASGKGPIPDTEGGIGFVDNADPNPECPKCQGEGRGEILISDTRDLEKDEQNFYLGVKQTKNGIEVLTESKQAARAMLLKIIADKQDEDEGNVMNVMPMPTSNNVDDWEKVAQSQQDESLGT